MEVGRGRRQRRTAWTAALGAAVVVGAFAPSAQAAECDPIMPVAEVTAGMTGTGWTVSRGRTPEPFSVDVLGVLPNEFGPGRDMILVEASSPAIQRAGGIWFGISGSPVYVGGRLVGAVSYGFGTASGPTAVAGLTAAEDMAPILAYPTGTSARRVNAYPESVELPGSARRAIARETGTPVAGVAAAMTRLRLPFSVSGMSARGLAAVERFADRSGLSLVPYGGSSVARAGAAAADPLEPGDNFAAVTSYGDITTGGIGTTTYVCEGRALAFGHPFFFSGETTTGANHADTLTVVPDPVFGPFKLARIAESVGRVDQDRFSGLRALVGDAPAASAIRSTVAAPGVGARRDGATDVVLPGLMPLVSFLHLISNIDSTFDAISAGSSSVAWTIRGTRADGAPWELTRANVHASGRDIGAESSFELASYLELLLANPWADVGVTDVRVDARVDEEVRLWTVKRVLLATGRGRLRAARSFRAAPGALLRARVELESYDHSTRRNVDTSIRLPRSRGTGYLEIFGAGTLGEYYFECFLYADEIEECGLESPGVDSFDELLTMLGKIPTNDVLSVDLRTRPRYRVVRSKLVRVDGVVRGGRMIPIGIGTRPGGGGEEL